MGAVTMQARVIAAWLVFGAFLVTAAGSMYLGYQWADASWTKKEAKWVKVVNDERLAQQKALGKVNAEVERLRERPERVRVVVRKEIEHVVADAECSSLPPSTRFLWNADPDDPAPAGAARVGDEGLRPVAADAG